MMKKAFAILCVVVLFFTCQLLIAQSEKIIHEIDSINALAKSVSYTEPAVSLSHSSLAYAEASKVSYHKGIAESRNNMGIIYFNWGVYEYAFGYFYEAAMEYSTAGDSDGFSRALNNLGVSANIMKQYDISLQLFFYSLKVQKRHGNYENMAEIMNNIASIYTDLQKYSMSELYLGKAQRLCDSIGYSRGLSNVLNNRGVLYQKRGQLDSAIFYYRLAFDVASNDPEKDYQKYLFLQNQAIVQEMQGLYHESLNTLNSGFEEMKSYGALAVEISYYQLYSTLYAHLGEHEKAWQNLKMYIDKRDELMSSDVNQKFTEMIISFQQEQYKRELKLMDEKIKFRRNFQWALSGVIIVLLVVVLLLFFYLRAKSALARKTKELSILEKEAMQVKIQQSEEKQEELKEEISLKERELVSKSLNLISKTETIDDLQKFVADLVQSGHLSKTSTVYKQMDGLIKNALRVDSMWQDFFMHFENVYPHFFSRFKSKFPELTMNDLKFCAYLKLNLNNKDLARIYNVSEQSLKIKKNRLRKKMKLESSQDLNDEIAGEM